MEHKRASSRIFLLLKKINNICLKGVLWFFMYDDLSTTHTHNQRQIKTHIPYVFHCNEAIITSRD